MPFRQHLLPGAAERDEPFRQEMLRASHAGLRILAAVEIAAPVFMYLLRAAFTPQQALQPVRLWQMISVSIIGAATFLAVRSRAARARPRLLALVSACAAAVCLIWVTLLGAPEYFSEDDMLPAGITVAMFALVAAVPVWPVQMLAAGIVIEAAYVLARWAAPEPLRTASHDVFILILTTLGAGIAAVAYAQRRSDYQSHLQALRIHEALSGAQLRAQLAESAIAIGKMAAALTHEINTPLGALKSAVDTMLVLAAKEANAPPEQQKRLLALQSELRRSIQTSSERIGAVVARLQRFINLEEAEVRTANLNELLSDAAILFQEQIKGKIKLEFDFQPVPPLSCRPQLLSAVFSTLLSNAINAVDGAGRIVVSTRQVGGNVEVTIRDNGRGMPADAVENIFEPGFKVSGSRVGTGNWSLFNTRQIIYEHGGEIQIDSAEGKGTTVSVTLPCQAA